LADAVNFQAAAVTDVHSAIALKRWFRRTTASVLRDFLCRQINAAAATGRISSMQIHNKADENNKLIL
jgi:hypothetical protein